MAQIWRTPYDGEPDLLPGEWALGDLGAVGDHPWSRANAWMYDGIVYGYRELGTLSDAQYWIRGSDLHVVSPSAHDAATYAAELTALNAGCNVDWRALGTDMIPNVADHEDGTVQLTCGTSGGAPENVIKASMPAWGVIRDVITFNAPGEDQQLLSMTYGLLGGDVVTIVTVPSPAAGAQWAAWMGEAVALWAA